MKTQIRFRDWLLKIEENEEKSTARIVAVEKAEDVISDLSEEDKDALLNFVQSVYQSDFSVGF